MNKKTYKLYEREIRPLTENVAKDSCPKACEDEKQLTKARLEELQRSL